ncbi:histidine phosphatase family protein [Calidifontibacter sp. DB0510]|uniref:Histidine phosphatase family protein n=1 Tax=Metallococcus carri TaxID=1656884 RepID=A0A967AZ23_9MICO|nr:histidine phosphatase family protein [Metallococcus carri]NHN55313.1 histidine phosphatase family protein [Metallococcus carri]NOP36390.1 histidine phosphatase family protein [Calidifontibacter sp. DB2511S]
MIRAQQTVVHLVRHGEVDNPRRVLYGRMPGFRLSALGRQMAARLADHLRGNDITHLVSSPMERAQETIEPLAEALHLPVTLDERVIEAGNDFEGLTVGADPKQLLRPRMWPKLINPLTPSWGEPYAEIAARMGDAVADARAAASGHQAVIVSHQLPIWTLRQDLEGKRLWHDPRRRECALVSITSLVYDGDRLVAVQYAEPAADLLPMATKVPGA